MLRHYYGYEYAQIGEFLGMTSGSVGAVLSRAHAALRESLAADFSTASPNVHAGRAAGRPSVERSAKPPEVLP